MKNDPVAAAAAGNASRSAAGYVAMVAVYVNAFIICATWQGISWTGIALLPRNSKFLTPSNHQTVASEIFPLDIRMLCVSLTTADTWLGSFIIARSTPYMISDLGYGAYFFFGAILILMGIWSFFCVPETKGKSTILKEQRKRSKEILCGNTNTFAQVSPSKKWTPCSQTRAPRPSGPASEASPCQPA